MKLVVAVVCMIAFVGCQDNPYNGKPATKKIEPGQGDPSKPQDPNPAPAPEPEPVIMDPTLRYSLSLPEVMFFTEGVESSYVAKAAVPSPGQAILTFTNLPTGMVYDKAAQQIVWLPDYSAADDLLNPASFRKVIIAQAQLKSDLDPISVSTKDFVIVVENATKP